MNTVIFPLMNTSFIFGSWLLAENFSVCPKNNGFVRLGGCRPPNSPLAPWLLRLWSC